MQESWGDWKFYVARIVFNRRVSELFNKIAGVERYKVLLLLNGKYNVLIVLVKFLTLLGTSGS